MEKGCCFFNPSNYVERSTPMTEQVSTTEVIESMPIVEAEKMLGVGKKYDIGHVLKCFDVIHWAKEENKETDEIPTIILAKNSLLRNLVSNQKKKYRFFTIESPFEKTCNKCKGAGEIYKFIKKTVDVNCHICGKKGTLKQDCPTCKGTGRFIKRWKAGGGVNLECKKCKGTKKVESKCARCLGKGTIPKPVLTHVLKSTTPCKKCNQLGYLTQSAPPKKKITHKKKKKAKRTPFTPVMDQSLADKIKAGIPGS